MRHRQLKAFHYVARFGGFSRAAEALFLTQPAISEQVRKLEQDYDTLLFHRERKRVWLTTTGEQLFLLTKRYFEVEDQIEEFLSQEGSAVEGELRIVADSAHHVTELLGQFKRRYPNTTITLRVGNSEKVVEDLRAYNAEIGVVGSVSPGKDIAVFDLGSSEIVAFAGHGVLLPSQKSATLKELAKYPLVFRENGSKTRQKLEEEARRQGITLTPTIVAEGREAVREVVASGAGIGFVSLAEYVHDARFRKIDLSDTKLSMSESLVYLNQRHDVKVIRAFMDIARKAQA